MPDKRRTGIVETKKLGPLEIEGVDMASLGDWMVVAFNNDVTTFEAVQKVLQTVCGYDPSRAYHYTLKIHTEGSAVVFWGDEERCLGVCRAFARIGVDAKMEKNE